MRVEMQPFPLCELKGSWRDMGVQYGKDMAPEIEHMAKWWEDVLMAHFPNFDRRKGFHGAISMYEGEIESYAPRWIEFMKGAGEGSGLGYETIFWINAASNLLEGPVWALKDIGGCTSLAVEPARTADGKTIIGQNLDWHPELKMVAIRLEPEDAPRAMTFALAGALPQLGVNENGYAAVMNTIGRANNQSGVLMNVICAEALFGSCIGEAAERITMAKRAMSFNHMLAAKDGAMVDFETTCETYGFLSPVNGRLVHTNHFQTSWLQEGDTFKVFSDTIIRQHWAETIIDAEEQVTIDSFKKVFTDHHGDRTRSICCHPAKDASFTDTWSTVLSVIIVPEDGSMIATHNPCENEYVEYSL